MKYKDGGKMNKGGMMHEGGAMKRGGMKKMAKGGMTDGAHAHHGEHAIQKRGHTKGKHVVMKKGGKC